MEIFKKNMDLLRRWPLTNDIKNYAYVPEEASPKIPIEGIHVTDLNTTFFKELSNSYTKDKSCSILFQLLANDSNDTSLIYSLDEIQKMSYDEEIFHFLDGIIYPRKKQTCVMTFLDRSLINIVLREFHESPFSGHLSEEREREKINTCIWGPMWQKDVSEYSKTCDRCQNSNKSTGKIHGNIIKIQEPNRPWKIVHMDWVMGLPPGGDRGYHACQVIVDRFSKTPKFLPCKKDNTSMGKAVLIWNIVKEIPNFPQPYGRIFTNCLGESYSSLQPTT
ncbi:hypothetical protein O181_089992 [Austropuccinia psidii MF-1]|uniref:Integrase zinc-binding domain-containing protein n=1 Tax=Austropuccinia psidii MF-1 TaxID=1389203 RepID=A0A9Q3IUN8_9BASI|nr:hypothetical protein [Austropuccinia psidii MF-1]